MNEHILESAAIYVNAYRDRAGDLDARGKADLRAHVVRMFGAVYAAILVA